MIKLGIGSYTFTWAIGVSGYPPRHPVTAFDLLEQARTLEVDVVQYCDNLPLSRLNDTELTLLVARAQELGIDIEIGTRGLDTEGLLRNLAIAQQVGAPFVRVVIDVSGDEPAVDEVVNRLRSIVPYFAEAGISLAVENHDQFKVAELAYIVEILGTETVGICLDTVNSFGAIETPGHVLGILGTYTLNLHVKDFVIGRVESNMGFVVSGSAVGMGRLNVPWVIDSLRTFGREPNAIVELWTPFGATIEETIACEQAWAVESVRYMKSLLSSPQLV